MSARPARPLYTTPPAPPPSVPLSLALDPLPAPEEPSALGLFKRRNRTSLPLSDAERFKNVYRSDPSRPLFAASMTHLPRFSTSTRESHSSRESPSSPHLRPPSTYAPSTLASKVSLASPTTSRSNSGDSHFGESRSCYEPRSYSYALAQAQAAELEHIRYEPPSTEPVRYEPLRASSAAHARVQRKLQKSGAGNSTLSLSVVPEFEEDRSHRVFGGSRGSRVGRWMRRLVRTSKD